MEILNSEWRMRIDHWIKCLSFDLYRPFGEIKWEACRTMEQLSYDEAMQLPFSTVEPGFTWGEQWEYCWFRGRVTIPQELDGKRVIMSLVPGGESVLFVNGQSFGTYRADWNLPPYAEAHHWVEDNYLTREAKAGETFDIVMETYAGHYFPTLSGACDYGPHLEGLKTNPLKDGERRTLGVCTFGEWNELAYQLRMDITTLDGLLSQLDQTSLRAAKIADALEQMTLAVDFEQSPEKRDESYKAGREVLRPLMEAENGSTMPVYYAVGNSHLDLAWLWPLHETYRKTARTFAAQLRHIEEYPEYKFIQSQPASYEMCKKYYPELYARIKEAVKAGQWIADGAMYVEPDTNMTSGESLIRQLMVGKKFYKEEFDVDSEILWLPDTFGYTSALPKILNGCGVKYLVTQKIFWSYNESENFPYHYFTWRGNDGSEVTSFLPTSYTYTPHPVHMNTMWKERRQVRDLDAFLIPYGYGDGGGGPTRDHIEYALRQKNLEGSVKIKMAGPKEFFEDMEAQGGPKHTYAGELYFTAHRGTYTSQALVKKNNRKSEFALHNAEFWNAMAGLEGKAYPAEDLETNWKEVLLYQFHDILPGSSIAKVYVEANAGYKNLLENVNGLTETAQNYLTKDDSEAISVMNSLGFERKALVKLPDIFANGAELADGTTVPVYPTEKGLTAVVTVPSYGAVSLRPAKEAVLCEEALVSAEETAEGFVLENEFVKAIVAKNGEVTSFVVKESGREIAAGNMNHFQIYKDVPRLFDAWDIDSNYILQEVDGAFDVQTELVQTGVEAVVKMTGRISESTFTQYIRLEKGSKRLVFDTEVDWKELHRLLKVGFPVRVFAENGINEMQFGYVERPTHRSRQYDKDRFEVCNHRYSALCEGSHGAAVLNDCKYGISMNDNRLELTLLRASACPEMRADNHVHHFTYAFTAWEGDFMTSDVVKQGYEVNMPVDVVKGALDMSFMNVEKDNIFIDTIKMAEDGSGDIIARLYEAKKATVTTKVNVALPAYRAYLTDMLENVQEELSVENGVELTFHPFEVKTIRFVKGE